MLLEVNANPSLRIDYEQEVSLGIVENVHSPVDELIKRPLVMDTLLVMAPRTKARRSALPSQQGRHIDSMLNQCWPTVVDGGPTLV